MFNDKCSLTDSVLDGTKTMTRRVSTDGKPKYEVGELVAIKQSYEAISRSHSYTDTDFVGNVIHPIDRRWLEELLDKYTDECNDVADLFKLIGWTNKMFVKNELMPHHIQITNVRQERLKAISDEDCIAEGIKVGDFSNTCNKYYYDLHGDDPFHVTYNTPQRAFASLINRTSGKGTWDCNPMCYVYSFKLID